MQSIQITNQSVVINWRATAGVTYRVQYATNFANPNWQNLPGDVISPWASKTDSGVSGQRFYRVVVP